ncbi:MAG TPA: hypothetical protein PKN87_05190 [Syntrophomonadaceae bacterium]|nr:hypothetical protein [Syntrophomonadaceae bacterium]HPR92886.1 hypothetical protein [Syntrophomonadaceae bacterium]
MDLIWGLLLWAIGMYILYAIIRSAIDASETAQNIREIRDILRKAYNVTVSVPEEPYDLSTIPYNRCAACNGKLSDSDHICPHCGIKLD